MKSIRFRFLVAALAVMLSAAISKSQTADTPPPPPAHGHGHGFGMEGHQLQFYAKQLGITDTQKAQMKEVLQKEDATMKPLMQQMHLMDQQLKQYVEGTYDEGKVQAAVAAQAQTLVQMKVQETRIHNELYQMLTSDQQAKLKELEANRAARRQQHMQSKPASDPQE